MSAAIAQRVESNAKIIETLTREVRQKMQEVQKVMSKGSPAPPPQELTEEMKKLVEENAKLTAEVKRLHEQITLAQIEHGVKVVIRPFDYPAGYDPNAVNTQQVAKNKKEHVEQKVEVPVESKPTEDKKDDKKRREEKRKSSWKKWWRW